MSVDANKITRLFRWEMTEVFKSYVEGLLPSELKVKTEMFYDSLRKEIDWENLTREDFLALGFMCWEEYDGNELWLIPSWLYLAIPDGLHIVDIKHEDYKFSRNSCSTITKFGMLQYGFLHKVSSSTNTACNYS